MTRSIAAVKSSSETGLRLPARRQDSRFIDEIGEIGAREARRQRRDHGGIDAVASLIFFKCTWRMPTRPILSGRSTENLAVEPPRGAEAPDPAPPGGLSPRAARRRWSGQSRRVRSAAG